MQALGLHKTKARATSPPEAALDEIQRALGLQQALLRIECYDVSNLQGSEVVASMVVFEDGLARKSEYRRFTIRGIDGQNDVAAIFEVITRRFRRYLESRAETGELSVPRHRPRRRPDRIAAAEQAGGQLPPRWIPRRTAAAIRVPATTRRRRRRSTAGCRRPARLLDELGIDDLALCGLAKRLEEVAARCGRPPWCYRAPARGSTCCSGSATRHTGSPSPTTGSAVRSP